MTGYEWIVVAYFSGLTLAAWLVSIPPRQRRYAMMLGAAVVATAVAVALAGSRGLRAWIPHAYLIAGYWMPALLVTSTHSRPFEAWLARSDDRLRPLLPSVPAAITPVVELAYLLCYPLVPLSFAIVWMMGSDRDVSRFWLAILLSGYACYATLPWLVSRPPRLRREIGEELQGLKDINVQVLGRWSHQLNTFPSGHAAVAAAAAASVAFVSPPWGVAIGAVAGAISVGAAAGGYHYVIDVFLGLVVAAAAVAAAGIL
jgi:membrane-associated phospholipid phosphatase